MIRQWWNWIGKFPARFEYIYHFACAEEKRAEAARVDVIRAEYARRDERPRVDPTYVYILPPSGCMMAGRVVNDMVEFMPTIPVPRGSWVVAVGPAYVYEMRIGNQSQVCWGSDYNGQVAQLMTDCAVGAKIMVALRS